MPKGEKLMIKGCSRRMIVLKDTGSDFFDEAYFVLKSGKEVNAFSGEKDFVAEARRIISRSQFHNTNEKKERPRSIKPAFFSGFLLGALLSLFIFCVSAAI